MQKEIQLWTPVLIPGFFLSFVKCFSKKRNLNSRTWYFCHFFGVLRKTRTEVQCSWCANIVNLFKSVLVNNLMNNIYISHSLDA